jgi:lysophospholipase L1-like esterase
MPADTPRASSRLTAESPEGVQAADRPRRSGRRRGTVLLVRLFTMLLGLALPLIFLEASLRLLGPWLPGGYDTGPYLERHALYGHFHVPNHRGWMRAPEFITEVRISPLGLRDRRTSYEKPPGVYRVLLLGDSFLEGVQVQQWETVAERLEDRLNARSGGRPVEVINAGVAAYGTAQQLLLYEHEVHRYNADAVMLLFFVGNDVKNNSPELEIPGGRLHLAVKPYFELEDDGSLTLKPGPSPTPQHPVARTLRRCCWTYNVFEGNIFALLGQEYLREEIEVVGGARNYIRENYELEPRGEWAKAWRTTEAILARLQARTAADGAPLTLVGVPDWRALDPAIWQDELFRNRRMQRPSAPEAPTDHLAKMAARLQIPYLDLLPPLRREAAAGRAPLYYSVDGHWNPAGHRAAAEALAEFVRP